MIREAELFVIAEKVLVEVVGRIRGAQWEIVLPPLLDRTRSRPADLDAGRRRALRPGRRLGARPVGRAVHGAVGRDRFDGDLLGERPARRGHPIRRGGVRGRAVGRRRRRPWCTPTGATSASGTTCSELTITRAFLAHEIAMHLGSRACPLTEELARGLCETHRDRKRSAGAQPASSGSRCRCPPTCRGGTGSCSPPAATRIPWRIDIDDPARRCWTGWPSASRRAGTRTGSGSPTGAPARSSRSTSTARRGAGPAAGRDAADLVRLAARWPAAHRRRATGCCAANRTARWCPTPT